MQQQPSVTVEDNEVRLANKAASMISASLFSKIGIFAVGAAAVAAISYSVYSNQSDSKVFRPPK
jgi:hypothetical protein